MEKKRVFTEEELKEIGTRTLDLVLAAIDARDTEGAKGLARRMYKEFLSMHDSMSDVIAGLCTYIYERHGDEELYQALFKGFENPTVRFAGAYKGKNPRDKLKALCAGLRGHLGKLRIEEDDEKFCVMPEPCPTGGRMVLSGMLGPPCNFAVVKKPQVMTYYMANFPAYCAHCAIMEILLMERGEIPFYFLKPPSSNKLGQESCCYYQYKDLKAIPIEFYTRFGKQKPKD